MIRLPFPGVLHLQPMRSRELGWCRFFFYWLTRGPCCSKHLAMTYPTLVKAGNTFMANDNQAISSGPRGHGGQRMEAVPLTTSASDRATLGSTNAISTSSIDNIDQSVGSDHFTTQGEIEKSDLQILLADLATQKRLCTSALNLSCPCPVCMLKGLKDNPYHRYPRHWPCGAKLRYPPGEHLADHHRWNGKFHCHAPDCKAAFKSMADLKRHSAMHCTNPVMHSCEKPGCDRVGDNGFTRKDKLRDHLRQKHKGMTGTFQGMRALAPKSPTTEGKGKAKATS